MTDQLRDADRFTPHQALEQLLDVIALEDEATFLRKDLQQHSLDVYKHDFARRFEIIRALQGLALQDLPRPAFELLQEFVDDTKDLLLSARALQPLQSDFGRRRQALGTRIEGSRGKVHDVIAPAALAIAMQASDAARLGKDREVFQSLVDRARASDERSEGKIEEVEAVLARLREQTQTTTISKHADVFAREATASDEQSRRWLTASAIAAVALAGVIGWHIWFVTRPLGGTMGTELLVQLSTAKIIAYSFFVTVVIWLGRNYRLTRHNALVNAHRANALRCFEALALSTADPDARHAILLQATQSIFSPQATGFIDIEKDSGGSAQILELYRGASSATK